MYPVVEFWAGKGCREAAEVQCIKNHYPVPGANWRAQNIRADMKGVCVKRKRKKKAAQGQPSAKTKVLQCFMIQGIFGHTQIHTHTSEYAQCIEYFV